MSPCTTTSPASLASSFISIGGSAIARPIIGLPMAWSVITGSIGSRSSMVCSGFFSRGADGLRSLCSFAGLASPCVIAAICSGV